MASTTTFHVHVKLSAAGFDGEARKAGAGAKDLGDKSKDSARKVGDLERAVKSLRTALAALGIGAALRETVRAALDMERATTSLRASTGDASGSLAFLRAESQRLGLVFRDQINTYSQLAAASRGTKLEGQGVRDVFTAVAEAATVFRLSGEQVKGTMNALQQMISKGKISAEELRQQLGERLPGAVGIMARALGVSTAELNKMLESGQLISEDVLPRFAEQLRKEMAGEVESASQSAGANLNRLQNVFFELTAAVGEGLVTALGEAAKGLGEVGSNDSFLQMARDVGVAVGTVIGWIAKLVAFVASIGSAWRSMRAMHADVMGDLVEVTGRAITAILRFWADGLDRFGLDSWAAKLRGGADEIEKTLTDVADGYRQVADDQRTMAANAASAAATGIRPLANELKNARGATRNADDELRGYARTLDNTRTKLREQKEANAQLLASLRGGLVEYELTKQRLEDEREALEASLKFRREHRDEIYRETLARANERRMIEATVRLLQMEADWRNQLKDTIAEQTAAAGDEMTRRVRDGFANQSAILQREIEYANELAVALKLGGYEAALAAQIKQEAAQRSIVLTDEEAEKLALLAREARKAAKDVERLMETATPEARTNNMLDDFQTILGVVGKIAEGLDEGLANAIVLVGQLAAGMQAAYNATDAAGRAAGGAQTGQAVGALGQQFGWWKGDRGVSQFGGRMSGDYGDVGAMAGGAAGAVVGGIFFGAIGAAIGSALGSIAGGIKGGMIKRGADEGIAEIELAAGEIGMRVIKAEGKLGDAVKSVGEAMIAGLEQMATVIGGTLESLPNMGFKIRDDQIKVWVGEVVGYFKDVDEAVRFAVLEALKQADISGLSQEMATVLANTTAASLEELTADLEFGKWFERLGLDQMAVALDDIMLQFAEAVRNAQRLGLDVTRLGAWLGTQMTAVRNGILGVQESPEARIRREAAAFNQQLQIIRAEQEAKKAELLVKKAQLQAEIALMRAEMDLSGQRLELRAGMLDAEGSIVEAEFGMLASMMAALQQVDTALAAVDLVLANLPNLISDEDIANALRNAGGGGGGGDRRARADNRRDILDEVAGFGLGDVGSAFRDVGRWFDDLKQRIIDAGFGAAKTAALLAQLEDERRRRDAEIKKQLLQGVADFMKRGTAAGGPLMTALGDIDEEFNRLREGLLEMRDAGEITRREFRNLVDGLREAAAAQREAAIESAGTALLLDLYSLLGEEEKVAQLKFDLTMAEFRIRRAELELAMRTYGLLDTGLLAELDGLIARIAAAGPGIFDGGGGAGGHGGPSNPGSHVGEVVIFNNHRWKWTGTRWVDMGPVRFGGYGDPPGGGGGTSPSGPDPLAQARELLKKYQREALDPLTRSLRQIDDDFAIIRKALGDTAEVMGAYAAAVAAAIDNFLKPIKDKKRDLLGGDLSVLDAHQKLAASEGNVYAAMARFRAGDLSVIQDIPGLIDAMLRDARFVTPLGSQRYAEYFDFAQKVLDEILKLAPGGLAKLGAAGNPMHVAGMAALADEIAKLTGPTQPGNTPSNPLHVAGMQALHAETATGNASQEQLLSDLRDQGQNQLAALELIAGRLVNGVPSAGAGVN